MSYPGSSNLQYLRTTGHDFSGAHSRAAPPSAPSGSHHSHSPAYSARTLAGQYSPRHGGAGTHHHHTASSYAYTGPHTHTYPTSRAGYVPPSGYGHMPMPMPAPAAALGQPATYGDYQIYRPVIGSDKVYKRFYHEHPHASGGGGWRQSHYHRETTHHSRGSPPTEKRVSFHKSVCVYCIYG
jgi:hypothetical protein